MEYIGQACEDMLVQKAYNDLRERGYSQPLQTCYWTLLGVLQREGSKALDKYVETVMIR